MTRAEANERTVLVYWSRRGAFSQPMLELAELLAKRPGLGVRLSISDHNEQADGFAKLAPQVQLFPTFSSGIGALSGLPRLFTQVRRLVAEWQRDCVGSVVVLMPHVWSPILGYFVRKAGLKYAVLIHDADPHIGDATALLNRWLYSDVGRADVIFALSKSVAGKLAKRWHIHSERIVTLFLPYMTYPGPQPARPHKPVRLLFLGRILAYKGLPLLVSAVESLRAEGMPIGFGVVGEGDLTALEPRLATLGTEVINKWITHAHVVEVQSRYDIIVLPYIEASQSGIIMNAFGAGMPVIVTPVGGLAEQVENGVTGLVAKAVTANAIADSIRQLTNDHELYAKLVANISRLRESNSVETFTTQILAALRSRL